MGDSRSFDAAFRALTGNEPFPWQQSLYERFASGDFPPSCDLPTGLGKTSVIAIWLIALADNPTRVPRRLVYVVNRRTVVDQATEETRKIRDRLAAADRSGILAELSHRLAALAADPTAGPLAISTLRGQFADNAEWRADPARPAVVVGTIDMIGSRLLFSGYGLGFKSRPLHAGFLGQDALIVHDEAHLEPAFQALIEAIRDEQKKEPSPLGKSKRLTLIALTATPRRTGKPFHLTDEEKSPPERLPDKLTEPVHFVWQRLKARKGIAFQTPEREKEKVADRIGKLAKNYADNNSGKAVLVFVSSLEDHATVCKALSGNSVQVLTGTLRGLERDLMADPLKKEGCPIFARFLKHPKPDASENERWKITPKPGTVFLVCTSAGEVGIDISADHMVCDLAPFDRMAQRFGRVNRFGSGDANIEVVHEGTPDKKKENDHHDQSRWKTLELLKELPVVGDRRSASPLQLMKLRNREELKATFDAAYSPEPPKLPTSDILFDAWALTTVTSKLPGRPPVEPYLHGIEDKKAAETSLAWRQEVWELRRDFVDEEDRKQFQEFAAEILGDYPLKPHELLRDSTFRNNSGVRDKLTRLAEANGSHPVWIQEPDGSVIVTTLLATPSLPLAGRIVILPPEAGGLSISDKRSAGLFDGSAEYQPEFRDLYDVADEWNDDKGQRRRVRVWDDDPHFEEKTKGMRLVRPPIDATPDPDNDESADDTTNKRFWHWYELPQSADGEGSKTAQKPVLWQVHRDDVARNVEQVIEKLPLSDDIKKALILAARFHDLGKIPARFQRILGNMNPDIVLAKSGMKKRFLSLPEDCRHEFGSLLDVLDSGQPYYAEFAKLSDDMQDVVLHLIAAHHGRARPHFPADEAFDLRPLKGIDVNAIAADVPRRFARLQRKYGRWGLAYLESLLRAADWAASARPSAFVEKQQEVQL